jgi:hypothetical protein
MRLIPIETVGIAADEEAMMQTPAEAVLTAHACNVSASDMNLAADRAFMHAAAETADMGTGIEPADMPAAESTHVSAAAEAAATRFRRNREQARRKQGRGQNRCHSHFHDTSFPG